MRGRLVVFACASALLAGCGEKEEITSSPESTRAPRESSPAPAGKPKRRAAPPSKSKRPAEKQRDRRPGAGAGASRRSAEDEPGGAGDEIPARAQASITGRRGRLSPRVVRVPPFIAVQVELRSADGRPYRLNGPGKTLSARGRRADRATFDGLRPGRRLVMRGTGGRVVVEASAEPGP